MKAFLQILFCLLFSYKGYTEDFKTLGLPIDKKWAEKRYKKREKGQKIRICVVVNNFGIHYGVSNLILNRIPREFSLSISPYANDINRLLRKINLNAHDCLFIQPMSTFSDTDDTQDPYRLNIHYDDDRLFLIVDRTLKLMPCKAIAVSSDHASPVLKNFKTLTHLLCALKEKKLPFFSPEMALDNDLRRICKAHEIPCFEADYYITNIMPYADVLEILKRAKELAIKTGFLLLAVDAQYFNIKEVVDWLQKFPQEKIELISLKDVIDEE